VPWATESPLYVCKDAAVLRERAEKATVLEVKL
jgi:hypothetical protein